ncbi:MarR family transcriptional regulator [Mycobacterium yunnanensis]|uniref:MarR family transcriptional regulator n=1 Tax=Mycobacterium yunnanensis TaxID=368477 RepID=A0A9X3C0D7_9MYCO|nr:MarR family transcriptional regulator [Mycobacterium yunnanensis]MCV7420578.1 MarR family transcriptional regulator [Mycobacterium yunnanensis]
MTARRATSRHDVNKQLSFALYGAANRLVRMHKPFLAPLGLTFPQYLVMLELLGEAPRPVGELGAKLGMDTGTITPLVKRLELSGLITRRRDPSDERRVLVDLTPAGEALRDGVWAVPDQIKTACQISDDKARELREALDDVGRA